MLKGSIRQLLCLRALVLEGSDYNRLANVFKIVTQKYAAFICSVGK